jgi:hypothetical protein
VEAVPLIVKVGAAFLHEAYTSNEAGVEVCINFLASHMSTNLEPFQRTDIGMQPLGLTILEVLNCRFHKIKCEKARYRSKR